MKGPSIRWRLTGWHGAVLAVMLIGFSVVIYLMTQQRLLTRTEFELDEELDEFQMEVSLARDLADLQKQLEKRFGQHATFDFQLTTLAGETLFRSKRLAERALPLPVPQAVSDSVAFANRSIPGLGPHRIAVKRLPGPTGPMVVQAAAPLASNAKELHDLVVTLVSVGPIVLGCALAGGYILARRALAPLDRMIAAAERISAQRLNQQLEVSNPRDELGRLAQTLNGMLGRLHRSFDEMRRFTADAAHELRTPLAVLRSEVEVALQSTRSAEQYQHALESVLEETARLTRLTDQLLMLCREDMGVNDVRRESVRLDTLAREVVDDLQVVAEQQRVALRAGRLQRTLVEGDPGRLRQVCFNLLDNAIKYTPPRGAVIVRSTLEGGRVQLIIEDTGIGISHEHQPHIFKRFYRVDSARNGAGTGLGLAICKAIVEAHHGRIDVESAVNRGTCFTITLPKSTVPAGKD